MWDWAHFKEEGWWSHSKRSIKLAVLLLLSGCAMVLHLLVPFWQQPRPFRREEVARQLCEGLEKGAE